MGSKLENLGVPFRVSNCVRRVVVGQSSTIQVYYLLGQLRRSLNVINGGSSTVPFTQQRWKGRLGNC